MFNQFIFLLADLKRLRWASIEDFFYLCFEPGVWAVILYRLSRFLFLIKIPVLKILLRLIAFLIYKFYEIFFKRCLKAGHGNRSWFIYWAYYWRDSNSP